MKVQVVYAMPDQQSIVELDVPDGTTVFEAALQSGLADQFPEIDLDLAPIGIYGVRVKKATTTILHPGDRVELYRSLLVDPKESRRTRAESQKRDRS
jgi:putative ubiquitin-RnfH superfamily antitoxin RatB of RatAB toxin-antitoxin module